MIMNDEVRSGSAKTLACRESLINVCCYSATAVISFGQRHVSTVSLKIKSSSSLGVGSAQSTAWPVQQLYYPMI